MAVVDLRRPGAGTSVAIDRDAISMTRHGVTKPAVFGVPQGTGPSARSRDIPVDSRCRVPSTNAQHQAAAQRTAPGTQHQEEAGEPMTSGYFDSFTHPVAITGQSVIGDQIRVPTAGCAMAGCEAAFADPAALGEADNKARAVAAGWARDDLGRLVCPACQHDRPVPPWWVYSQAPRPVGQPPRAASQERGPVSQERGPVSDRRPAVSPPRPADSLSQPVAPAAAGGPPAPGQSRHHRAQWPRLLSALVNTRDGSAPRHEQATHGAGHVRTPRA
jgi:hypothetical protein